jgi:hypothetical protein
MRPNFSDIISLTRFRWVFCQLETLRQCLPQSVKHTLNELPESLDETYERLMMVIKRANQVHAYRMLQCLTVAVRPLSVAELAELLAFDFDVSKDGIPKLNSDWRWEDHEQAVLSTCSSLITVVPGSRFPVVQFSHFSVKEFLMSDRLAMATGDISRYHISLTHAHTLLARACLGVLLRDPDVTDRADPLAPYAAKHWVTHAQVEDVASRVCDGMERLFDPHKPHFEAWVQLHDADAYPVSHAIQNPEPGAKPLYYAALCGFHELVEHLLLKFPECAGAQGGRRGTALHSASFAGHLQIVRSLLRHGVGVDVRGNEQHTPLLYASQSGHRDIAQYLIEHGADVNLQLDNHDTSLIFAAHYGYVDIVRMLLQHGGDVNFHGWAGDTPLHAAVKVGKDSRVEDYAHVVRLLLEYGPDVDAKDEEGRTPLGLALKTKQVEIAQLLSEFRSGQAQT